MKFVTLAPRDAEGGLLAHGLRLDALALPKGHRLGRIDCARLADTGVDAVTVAMIEPGDVPEDVAAARAATAIAGAGLRASAARDGRCDLVADFHGLVLLAPEAIQALNILDESITVATLAPFEPVSPGQAVATVKVNPFAAPQAAVARWQAHGAALRLAAFQPHRAALIQTLTPGFKPSLLDKTASATRGRLAALGGALAAETRVAHEVEALAQEILNQRDAGADPILICGARSTCDRGDVVPAAIAAAGGAVESFGMPVEPGNLLTLGSLGTVRIVGMPGCARSRQRNGFDFVLQRLLARLPLGRDEIAAMGVGGLLRAAPHGALESAEAPARRRIAAIVLAAGQSRRMGANKLLLTLEGKPVVRHVLDAIAASRIERTLVVLGHEAEGVRTALGPTGARFIVNEDYACGLSTSLRAGIAALAPEIDGAMIFLGDMPDIAPELIDRMIEAFDPARMQAIVAPKRGGRRGHPVLWGRGFFPLLLDLEGDSGAKFLLGHYRDWVAEIEADTDGVLLDLDTPEAYRLRQARQPA
jgi:molybdenum cofactor cytidylyltransferase